jgi:hypothetical protein
LPHHEREAYDDPLYRDQEGSFFHGYYRCYCYLPLYIFCGEHLLCARFRPSNQDGAAGSVEELTRIVVTQPADGVGLDHLLLQSTRHLRAAHQDSSDNQLAKNQAIPFTELKKLSGSRCECFDDNAALKNGLKWLGRTAFR